MATHEMNAKCPYCLGQKEDCPECGGTGFIKAKLNTDRGVIFFSCPKCDAELGGKVPQSDSEIPEKHVGPSNRKCIFCGQEETIYHYFSPLQADQIIQKEADSEDVPS